MKRKWKLFKSKHFRIIYIVAFIFTLNACRGVDKSENYAIENSSAEYVGGTDGYSEPGYDSYSMEENDYTEGDYEDDYTSYENGSTPSSEPDMLNQQMVLDRKLIKNASLSFETDSLESRKRIIDNAVKEFSAYVENEEQYALYDVETVVVTIRVPSKNFDAFLETATQGVGSYDSKTISMDDVTEEYVDVEARIHTKKELKKRFIALLDKAETIKKIMEVEREIAALQAEIESFEGRLKYLSSSVKYATVSMTYYKNLDVPMEYDNKFGSAFDNGWEGFVYFFVGLVSIWPILLIILIVLTIVIIRIKKKKITYTKKSVNKNN